MNWKLITFLKQLIFGKYACISWLRTKSEKHHFWDDAGTDGILKLYRCRLCGIYRVQNEYWGGYDFMYTREEYMRWRGWDERD